MHSLLSERRRFGATLEQSPVCYAVAFAGCGPVAGNEFGSKCGLEEGVDDLRKGSDSSPCPSQGDWVPEEKVHWRIFRLEDGESGHHIVA